MRWRTAHNKRRRRLLNEADRRWKQRYVERLKRHCERVLDLSYEDFTNEVLSYQRSILLAVYRAYIANDDITSTT